MNKKIFGWAGVICLFSSFSAFAVDYYCKLPLSGGDSNLAGIKFPTNATSTCSSKAGQYAFHSNMPGYMGKVGIPQMMGTSASLVQGNGGLNSATSTEFCLFTESQLVAWFNSTHPNQINSASQISLRQDVQLMSGCQLKK